MDSSDIPAHLRAKRYHADSIVVTWDKARCTHAAECVRGLPMVFQRDRRPWIDPSAAPADDIAEVIRRCPTGALQYARLDGGAPEVPGPNEVVVQPDGPTYIRGNIVIENNDGETLLEDTRVALCRCGHSANKPLCDGTHRRIGFSEAGRLNCVGAKEAKQEVDGRLRVIVRPSGSLRFVGPFVIRTADGSEEQTGTTMSLCQCGHSGTRPFCDGTHKTLRNDSTT